MRRILATFLALILVFFAPLSTGGASSFDEIMSLPDSEESDTGADYLEFDDFLQDFQYYCKSWNAGFDTSKKQTKTLEDGRIVLQLDGIVFWLKVDDDRHEITQISVKLGDSKSGNSTNFNMLVKACAMIASLEYKRPATTAERSAILSSVLKDFQQYIEPAVEYALSIGSFPVSYYGSSYSYAVTYSEQDGYDLIVVISRNSKDASEKSEPPLNSEAINADEVQIQIVDFTVGENASITVKNNRDWTVTEITFRARYYDESGEYILTDDTIRPVKSRIANLSIPIIDGGLIPGQTLIASASGVPLMISASRVDIAVSEFKTDKGQVYYTEESNLDWYSSDAGYLNKCKGSITNRNYFDERYADGGRFSLGIRIDYVYPEFMQYYGVEQCGYLIASVDEGSIFDRKGVQVGDVLFSCNGSKWFDDPLIIDRAKYELTQGKDATFDFVRGKEVFSVQVLATEIWVSLESGILD